jgi:hypothetical protein
MNDSIAIPEADEDHTVRLTPAEFAATWAKIDKMNARFAKRGFTGRFELTGERVEETKTNALGFTITEVVYKSRITGETPKYNGWSFLARVDVVADSFTIAAAPGVDRVDRDLVRPGHCDHCSHNRARKNTYLVVNEDGEVKNVGSTCIKDFLGWQGNFAFISEAEVKEDCFGAGYGGGEHTWTVDSVLAAAYAAIKAYGFTSTKGDGRSTASVVRLIIGAVRPTKKDEAELHLLRDYADEATAKAVTVREWILSDEFKGDSGYVDNLKAVTGAGEAGWAQLGLLASAPQAYIRHLETAAEREAREAQWAAEKLAKTEAAASSAFLGEVKDKIEFRGTVTAIRYIESNYGTTTLYTILTAEKNLVKWFASSEVLGDTEGAEVHLVGTIKELDTYNGTKSTVVTRCSKVNPDTGKPFSARISNKHWESEWVGDERVYAHATPHPDCENCYKVAHNIDLN